MTFARYFGFWSYCLMSTGFIALTITGGVDLPSTLLFGSALVASLFIDTARMHRRIPPWLLNSLAALYPILFLLDYRYYSRSFVLSTIHLLFFVAAIKVLTRTTDRDDAFLYLLSFTELLAACTLTVDLSFIVSFLVFLLAGVSTLVLFEMRRGNARAQSLGRVQPLIVRRDVQGTGMELLSPFPAKAVFGLTLAITISILVLALPLFLVLPRISLGIYGRPAAKTQLISGFSDHVRLGEIGTIKQSDAIVMRVRMGETPGRLPESLKWRGISLDHYDGRSWTRRDITRRAIRPSGRYFQVEGTAESTNLLWQTFYLEALTTNVVFVTHRVMAVTNELPFLQQDSAGNLFTRDHASNKIRYSAISELRNPDPQLIPEQPVELPDSVQGCCLQLPRLDPRTQKLAEQVTASIRNPYEKAIALERFLRFSYAYSLDLRGSVHSEDPLATFLFDTQQGHCEYFASAMTIMLRQLGIPARLVNGFRAGEYNTLGEGWIVRQYDAHSWVEGYFAPYGWIEFDPTPAEPPRPRSRLASFLSRYMDAIDLWWADEVINYDIWKQLARFMKARSLLDEALRQSKQTLQALLEQARTGLGPNHIYAFLAQDAKRLYIGALLAGIFVCGLILIKRARIPGLIRSLRLKLRSLDSIRTITDFYAEALELLESNGYFRAPGQTPLEFSQSLKNAPQGDTVSALTRLYNRIRFGGICTPEDLAETRRLLHALRLSLRVKELNSPAGFFRRPSSHGRE